jgi:hypothetical protein
MRGLNLARIILCHNKNFRGARLKRERNGKNKARTEQDQAPPLFCPSWDHETKMRHSSLCLHGKGDASAFVAKRRHASSKSCFPLLV